MPDSGRILEKVSSKTDYLYRHMTLTVNANLVPSLSLTNQLKNQGLNKNKILTTNPAGNDFSFTDTKTYFIVKGLFTASTINESTALQAYFGMYLGKDGKNYWFIGSSNQYTRLTNPTCIYIEGKNGFCNLDKKTSNNAAFWLTDCDQPEFAATQQLRYFYYHFLKRAPTNFTNNKHHNQQLNPEILIRKDSFQVMHKFQGLECIKPNMKGPKQFFPVFY